MGQLMAARLERYLESSEGAGKVLAHAQLLVKMAAVYQTIVPAHLGQASRVANYKSGIVVLHASNGAVATKLRQMLPTLAAELSRRFLECRGVEVKVQGWHDHAEARAATQKPLSARTSQQLSDLSDSLPESPLRAALETLLARSARQE